MHELVKAVLEGRDVGRAGDLFTCSDWEIVSDLQTTLLTLKRIFTSPTYLTDTNSQSIVEISLARITSAIRLVLPLTIFIVSTMKQTYKAL